MSDPCHIFMKSLEVPSCPHFVTGSNTVCTIIQPRLPTQQLASSYSVMSNGRDIKKGDARFGAGLEGSSSSSGETSLVVLTLRFQIGNGGEVIF